MIFEFCLHFSADSASLSEISTGTRDEGPGKRNTVIKAAKAKSGSKLARNVSTSTSVTAKDILLGKMYKPNMTRRPKANVLYAFPSFDKCDSLLYFPTTMTRHLNSADFPSLSKLFNSHMERNCEINMSHCKSTRVNPRSFIQLFVLMNDIQPDRIMCVHNTKVVENHIHATLYMKFTDSRFIYESVLKTIKDPLIHEMMCGKNRTENLQEKINTAPRSEEERARYAALLQSDVDLLIYVRLEMDITFDDVTKRIIGLDFKGQMTSLHPAGIDYSPASEAPLIC